MLQFKSEIVNLELIPEMVIFFVLLRFVKCDLLCMEIILVNSLEVFKCFTEGIVVRMCKNF